ncbi:MAG: hypothetical protein PHO03_06545 [Candidatus Omnitrophica bacterium]|nr:hypothetical protein [Candidatus Omnitrophota bacterium]
MAKVNDFDNPDRLIVREGIEKELATLEIILAAKIGRTALTLEEYIQMRLSQGATLDAIRADLLTDLEEGGRIFGEFKNALQPTFAGSTSRFRDIGQLAETGISKTFRWVAVLVNTCPDCLERHNQIKTWIKWEEEGLPRSGATVCGQNCKCVLVSAEATALEPVIRG